MQHKKRFLTGTTRHYAAFLGIMSGLIFFNGKVLANLIPVGGGVTYSCALLVTSIDYMSGPPNNYDIATGAYMNPYGPYIYDDAYSNYYDGTAGRWNCSREFTIDEYTNEDITFDFTYGGEYTTPSTYPVSSHDIKLWRNGTGTRTLLNTWIDYPDKNSLGEDNTFLLSAPWTATSGEYTLEYWRHDGGAKAFPDISAIFVLQPLINNIWIEATPVCSDFSGTQYNFQVHSNPELNTLIQPSKIYGYQPCDADNASYENYIKLDFSACPFTVYKNWDFTGGYTTDAQVVPGNGWLNALTGILPAADADLNDYWMTVGVTPGDLGSYISSGTTPVITLTYTDGINYTTAAGTGVTINVPIIIESAVPAPLGPLYFTTPSYFPPQAVFQPDPSYDFFDYDVSGSETWTPTNNPVTRMHGGGTDNIIRIEGNLFIPPGTQLTMENMRLEMGPQAGINVENAASATAPGGFLIANSCMLTAYRGCLDQSGTDASTWVGLTLQGNSSFPAGSAGQSYAILNGTTISYADVGIQNGSATAAGGGFNLISRDTFYNNMVAINLWPHPSGQYATAANCTFIKDDNASWFVPNGFVNINDVFSAQFNSCKFINKSSHLMVDAISSLDATINVDACTFGSASSANNFQNALLVTAASGTHSLVMVNDTFNDCQVGAAIYGSMAPLLTGNMFNLPEYTGGGGTYAYPGTSAIVVPDQVIGALMQGTSAYTLASNIFQTTATTVTNQSGTLEYNTGSGNNQVSNNTFSGMGVAMNSNFVNSGISFVGGLQYVCNTDSHVSTDISVLGAASGIGGINEIQATYVPYTTTPAPTGNVFGSARLNILDMELSITYYWNSLVSSQDPNYVYVPLSGITITPLAETSECYTLSESGHGPYSATSATMLSGGATYASYYSDNAGSNPSFNYAIAAGNLNYYMTDSVVHRDSIYYWAAQLNSPYGDLLTANLLIEDSLIDSANAVYGGIINKYSLDSAEANDFTQGQYLENILISLKESGGNILSLNSNQISALQSVAANSSMWAHARAEGWLYALNGTPIIDSLLYPVIPDSMGGGERHTNPNPPTATAKLANKVYPNPVHSILQVIYTATTNDAIEIQIQDIAGQTVITQPLQSGVPAAVDMSSLAPGIYLYHVLEGTNITMVGKVAKD